MFSVIIPVKNGENYLQQALDSVKKQNANYEIIVINDGSTDKTHEIAEKNGCKVIDFSVSQGQAKARNAGLSVASGKYIVFLDHDDLMTDKSLETIFDEFKKDSKLQILFAKIQDFISPELSEEQKKTLVPQPQAYYGLLTGGCVVVVEVFEKVGVFDESLNSGEGVDLQMRFNNSGLKQKKIDFVSTLRRLHNSNYGRINKKQEFKDFSSILRSKLRK